MVQIQDCKAILLVEENRASLSLAENTTMKEGKSGLLLYNHNKKNFSKSLELVK